MCEFSLPLELCPFNSAELIWITYTFLLVKPVTKREEKLLSGTQHATKKSVLNCGKALMAI